MDNPRSGQRKLTFAGLKRAWSVLPVGWKIALVAALAWHVTVPLVFGSLILGGYRLPLMWRVLEAVSKFIALGVVIAAGRLSLQRLELVPTRREIALVVFLVVSSSYSFISPVF